MVSFEFSIPSSSQENSLLQAADNGDSIMLLTNTRDSQASLGYHDRRIPAEMTAHWPLSSEMRSNDDIDWPVHSLMLSFNDLHGLPLRRLPFTVLCSMIFGSVSWWHTWPPTYTFNNTTWWLQSAAGWCCIRLPEAIMIDTIERFLEVDEIIKELSFWCSFPPTALSWICVIWNLLVPLPRHVPPGLLACWESLIAWPCLGD